MISSPFEILDTKRQGGQLTEQEVLAVVDGAARGSWDDPQLAALLMAVAIRGLDDQETAWLTEGMLASGDQWNLRADVPQLIDKHSTGGVGDKVSLIFSPLLAACGLPVAMLTGRALGHTGGTADKLESIPGVRLELDREQSVRLLNEIGIVMGVATEEIAPADRKLYALRDRTGTVSSIPLVVGSILSKKLATGASAIVFDVKVGSGAFFPEYSDAELLCRKLVETSQRLGVAASGLLTDMSQPLGRWVGHSAEVLETFECLEGRGNPRLMEVVFRLAEEAAGLVGSKISRTDLENVIASGEARSRFVAWAVAQGACDSFLEEPDFALAPVEAVIEADRHGLMSRVNTKRIGELMATASRSSAGVIDPSVSLLYSVELGDKVEPGQEIARLYLRSADAERVSALSKCFVIDTDGQAPPLVYETVS